jgi:hypothetical protein
MTARPTPDPDPVEQLVRTLEGTHLSVLIRALRQLGWPLRFAVEPSTAASPTVQGHCPACSRTTLILGADGYLTCAHLDCPNPPAASDTLDRLPAASRTDKPPIPTGFPFDWPRIPTDDADGTDAWQIIRIATRAGDQWAIGAHGPYQQPGMSLSEITGGVIREALLHLLELGLIDIDGDRMHSASGWPVRREQFLPAATPEEPTP